VTSTSRRGTRSNTPFRWSDTHTPDQASWCLPFSLSGSAPPKNFGCTAIASLVDLRCVGAGTCSPPPPIQLTTIEFGPGCTLGRHPC
jgi:hypothetical protein